MSLGSKIENQPFAVRRVVLASGWRQGLMSLFKRRSTFFYVENGVIFIFFDRIPRVWRLFKMATMSVFLEEP